MYRLKIAGNFLLLINNTDQSEHFRHPLSDCDYEQFEELTADPLIRFEGISKPLKARFRVTEFKFSTLLNKDGEPFENFSVLLDLLNNRVGPGDPSRPIELAANSLGRDSLGKPKVTTDLSVFNSMFTYGVPKTVWCECVDGVEQSVFSNATSVNGKLNLSSGALNQSIKLKTFRNPKYQPNRGYMYSTSAFLPDANYNGIRRFGFFTINSGVFFELDSNGLYGVIRTTIDGVTSDTRTIINTIGVSLNKANLYDIQMQWRGVGEYSFVVNKEVLLKIESTNLTEDLTMFNPTSPVTFECINLGDSVSIQSGSVDITNEGGTSNLKSYGSIGITTTNGQVSSSGLNIPIIAIKSLHSINGLINTRDALLMAVNAYADTVAVVRIWRTRDFSAISEGSQTWKDFKDGNLQYIEYETDIALDDKTSMSFDITKASLLYTSIINQNQTNNINLVFNEDSKIYMNPGDLFVFTIHTEIGSTVASGATIEFAEEI
jgi:hypothetical protein